ncbi:MAG: hypothetical protein OEU09_09320, partial [Rhodospirillales bacterium]|nr:hypothetical protein [Rhodospirillales bacterium]
MTAEAIKTPEGPPSSITERTVAGRQARTRGLLLAPAMLVIGVFGILPLFIALTYSFLEGGTYGGVEWVFSTEAYVQLLFERDIFEETLTFNTAYLEIFWRSFLLAAFST